MTSFTDEIKSINTIKLTVMASEYMCTQALCPECPANYSAHSFKQNISTTEVATDDELYKLFQLYCKQMKNSKYVTELAIHQSWCVYSRLTNIASNTNSQITR